MRQSRVTEDAYVQETTSNDHIQTSRLKRLYRVWWTMEHKTSESSAASAHLALKGRTASEGADPYP